MPRDGKILSTLYFNFFSFSFELLSEFFSAFFLTMGKPP